MSERGKRRRKDRPRTRPQKWHRNLLDALTAVRADLQQAVNKRLVETGQVVVKELKGGI